MTDLFSADAIAARLPAIRGARNLRDMGGYPTEDGRRVRRGVLFRSGQPGGIRPADHPALLELGLRALVDLRTTAERRRAPFPQTLLETLRCWSREYDFSHGDIVARLTDPGLTVTSVHSHILSSYRTYPEEQHEGIAALFGMLQAGEVPVMINCTAGKDRTGVVCALLLSALGVPRDIVIRDYTLTEMLHDPAMPMPRLDPDNPYNIVRDLVPEIRHAMMRCAPEYIEAMFTALDEAHGGVTRYLATALSLEDEALMRMKDLLLE